MYVSTWLLVGAAALVGFLFWVILRLRRMGMALRYCYITLSDWHCNQMEGIRAFCFQRFSEGELPDDLLEFETAWKKQLKYHAGVMGRAGLPWVSKSDEAYPLYDD